MGTAHAEEALREQKSALVRRTDCSLSVSLSLCLYVTCVSLCVSFASLWFLDCECICLSVCLHCFCVYLSALRHLLSSLSLPLSVCVSICSSVSVFVSLSVYLHCFCVSLCSLVDLMHLPHISFDRVAHSVIKEKLRPPMPLEIAPLLSKLIEDVRNNERWQRW